MTIQLDSCENFCKRFNLLFLWGIGDLPEFICMRSAALKASPMPSDTDETCTTSSVELVQYLFSLLHLFWHDNIRNRSGSAKKGSQRTREGTGGNKDGSKGDGSRSCQCRALQCLGGQGHGTEHVEEREKGVLGEDYYKHQSKKDRTDPFLLPEPPL